MNETGISNIDWSEVISLNSYREYIELQGRAFMTEDEKLEKRDLDTMRYLMFKPRNLRVPEFAEAVDPPSETVKILEPGPKRRRK